MCFEKKITKMEKKKCLSSLYELQMFLPVSPLLFLLGLCRRTDVYIISWCVVGWLANRDHRAVTGRYTLR